MRYYSYYDSSQKKIVFNYGITYQCDHPVYNRCTLFVMYDMLGFAIIQQRFDPKEKKTWWSEVDPKIADDIYLHKDFQKLFDAYADCRTDDLYPTITVRQAMWFLKMKPLKREPWETVFDKAPI